MLKKVIPNQPQPELLGQEAKKEPEILELKEEDIKLTIPESKLKYGQNLKKLNGFREKRKNLKHQILLNEFIDEVENALSIFDEADKKYDRKLIQYICQIAEDVFTEKKMGEYKKQAVISVSKKYFDNNEKLVESLLEDSLCFIKKSTLYRRNKKRLLRGVFFVFKIVKNIF